jgi:hypothetical protein
VLLAAVLGALPGIAVADTGLARAPFSVQLTPSVLQEGAEASLRIEAREGMPADGTLFDIYVARIPSGPPLFRYLWPTGAWSQSPAPYQQNVFLPRFTPLSAGWREEGPAGWISVLVIFPHTGADPNDRASWVYQPVMRRVRIRAASQEGWRDAAWRLGPLAVAALVACALVLCLPKLDKRASK